MKSFIAKKEDVVRSWLLVDAKGQVLGRLAVKIANLLRGRNKPTYTPHVDGGDFIVVINAAEVKLTGAKETGKIYQRYSGYRSGLKDTNAAAVRAAHPERLIEMAVKGMLPKNALNRNAFSRLKVYAGSDHPHEAQKPQLLE